MTQTRLMPLAVQHLDAVYRIETQAHTHPWSHNLIRDINSRGGRHHVLLAEEQVVGYFYAQNIVGEVTLLNLAVDPACQGQGYGKMLLDGFLELCQQLSADSAWLEVRESNQRAYQLYDLAGFHEVDRRRNYYPTQSGHEDAIIMSYLFF
ncbi:ribosomal protein S18-alanine N-acetyltransferase [Vibrio sp. V39_P1S14PM300]|uniref:[Ribosomal protein bS18]-alanine N-acetyltransferase n=2 Tax=Vibrionaceae TaxID=641 RepID=U2ZIU2_VIBPR|nr:MULTISPECIES: ribosomal protein S18-alanine N-acetyltransferase [Vibrio]NAX22465.1 ribosomal protein S18-alanine N-acetyltransferase [Vibrio sp. V39_P1S14PM300]GAD67681.1 ribosomal-protein-alanine acetyltransferase RimI [Vibrio proteolyticus NBRC 13287]